MNNHQKSFILCYCVTSSSPKACSVCPRYKYTFSVFFCGYISDVFHAIRERFFINYRTYSFITFEVEFASSVNRSTTNNNNNNNNTTTATKTLSKLEWIEAVQMVIQRKCLDLLLLWIHFHWSEDFVAADNKDQKVMNVSEENDNNRELMSLLKQFTSEIKRSRDRYSFIDDNETLESMHTTFSLNDVQNNNNNNNNNNIRRNKDKKKKKKRNSNASTDNNNNNNNSSSLEAEMDIESVAKRYQSFLQSYIFKLENVISSQQQWFANIVFQAKNKELKQRQLLQKQIKKSENDERNRKSIVNASSAAEVSPSPIVVSEKSPNFRTVDTEEKVSTPVVNAAVVNRRQNQQRKDTNSIQTFSDHILHNIPYLSPMMDDDYDEDDDDDDDSYNNNNNNINNNNSAEYGGGGGGGEEKDDCWQTTANLNFIQIKNHENGRTYAKQLTLLDWNIFSNIGLRQILYKVMRKQYTDKYETLTLFIDRFQQTHQYVIVAIVTAPSLSARVEMIDFFVFVAEALLKLNNMYSFMAVCTALTSLSIERLRIAWEFVNKSNKRKLESFLPLCNATSNYKVLRTYMNDNIIINNNNNNTHHHHQQQQQLPAIPFLGLILRDLTFVHDGTMSKLPPVEEGDLQQINFLKYMRLYSTVYDSIFVLQQGSYLTPKMLQKQNETTSPLTMNALLDIHDDQQSKNTKTKMKTKTKTKMNEISTFDTQFTKAFQYICKLIAGKWQLKLTTDISNDIHVCRCRCRCLSVTLCCTLVLCCFVAKMLFFVDVEHSIKFSDDCRH